MTMTNGAGWTGIHLALAHPLTACAVCACVGAGAYVVSSSNLHEPTVVLTMDDALSSQIALGLPIAEEYGIKGTLYVPSALVIEEGDVRGWYMTTDDVTSFSNSGWEIGSHTESHDNMTEISPAAALETMTVSGAQLRGMTGNLTGNFTFSYPYGSHNDIVRALASSVYEYSVNSWSVANGLNVAATFEPDNINRWVIKSQDSLDYACDVIGKLEPDQTFVVALHGIVESDPQEYEIDVAQYRQLLTCITNSEVVTKTLLEAAMDLDIVQKFGVGTTSELVGIAQ